MRKSPWTDPIHHGGDFRERETPEPKLDYKEIEYKDKKFIYDANNRIIKEVKPPKNPFGFGR